MLDVTLASPRPGSHDESRAPVHVFGHRAAARRPAKPTWRPVHDGPRLFYKFFAVYILYEVTIIDVPALLFALVAP